jgi:hypothetical protein
MMLKNSLRDSMKEEKIEAKQIDYLNQLAQVFMVNKKVCMVVVKERDVKPEENLKELKDAVAERDVKILIFS